MKLKKIASLALAGIMAVSMLTACGEGGKKEEDPSSSEVTTVSGAAEALNAALSQNKDVIKFESDADLDEGVAAYYLVNPINADKWKESYTSEFVSADDNTMKKYFGADWTAKTSFENVLKDTSDTYDGKAVALIGMFNTKVYTQAEALKTVGKMIDNYDFAEDQNNTNDGKEFRYTGTASVLEVKSAKGAASVWVVVAVVEKDYVAV
ncbi:hypothetical protein B5G12_13275 [Faecalibacterium sp. An58]|uniref:hypothetical protein n=1 Tax=Faecalibacterium sp. An58 TaxID=1965648 RepID=UPI000B368F61|nr:hypothetical protein [Faecalibacterium sp. An58]OUN67948.1 hypothetical protein B5G12_13275 [Faecalibacterium sp. An58]